MNALLSIKPSYAEKILTREKKYEFRRTTFRDPSHVQRIILYATSPLQKIVGIFSLGRVIEATPEYLWEQFGKASGITRKQRFLNYFSGACRGYALEIDEVVRLDEPVDPRNYIHDFHPPVSFKYVNGEYDFIAGLDVT